MKARLHDTALPASLAIALAMLLLAFVAIAQHDPSRRQQAQEVESAKQDVRIEQIQKDLERLNREHRDLFWLLVGNLGAVAGGLAVHLLTHYRGRPTR